MQERNRMPEGSVLVDGVDTESTETQDSNEESSEETKEVEETQTDTSQESTQEEESKDSKEEVKYTEKGTKLDPNPASAAYQQLANERRIRQQYEQVLQNPALLQRYLEESGMTKTEQKEVKKAFDANNFKTVDDVANAFNDIQTGYQSKVQELENTVRSLKGELSGLGTSRRLEQVANKMQSDVVSVRAKYPELDPNSPDYDADLEKAVADFYRMSDYDQQTGSFMGKQSIAEITEIVMKAVNKARKSGSRQAQTTIKQKSLGKVVTSSKSTSGSSKETDDPGATIAQRINKLLSQ